MRKYVNFDFGCRHTSHMHLRNWGFYCNENKTTRIWSARGREKTDQHRHNIAQVWKLLNHSTCVISDGRTYKLGIIFHGNVQRILCMTRITPRFCAILIWSAMSVSLPGASKLPSNSPSSFSPFSLSLSLFLSLFFFYLSIFLFLCLFARFVGYTKLPVRCENFVVAFLECGREKIKDLAQSVWHSSQLLNYGFYFSVEING